MRIGLLSDTHMPEVISTLPPQVGDAFSGVDLILHGGDTYTTSVLDELEAIAPVLAAAGDDDYGEFLRDRRVKNRHILKFGPVTLWLAHERPYLHAFRRDGPGKPHPEDQSSTPDIVIFGHGHRPIIQRSGDILYVSPGSLTLPNYRKDFGTLGLLTVGPHEIEVTLFQLTAVEQVSQTIFKTTILHRHGNMPPYQINAQKLMGLTEGELETMTWERLINCGFHDPNGCHTTVILPDSARSFSLDERMKALGWDYEQEPIGPDSEGFWGYGVAYSSAGYWGGLKVEHASQIRKAKYVAAILAMDCLESPPQG